MKRRFWIGLAVLLALPAIVLLAAVLLLATEPGLHLALDVAQRFAPGTLTWQSASGRLVGPLQIDDVRYTDTNGEYGVRRFEFDWSPGRLLARRLSIHVLHAEGVELTLPAAAEDEPPSAPIEPGWSLPLELVVRDLVIRDFRFRQGDGAPLEIAELTAAANSGLEWIDFEYLTLAMAPHALAAQGRLGLGRQVATDLALQVKTEPEGFAPISAEGHLSGTWDTLQLSQKVIAPVPLEATVVVNQPFAELTWVIDLALPVARLDAIATAWPAQRLGGQLRASGDLHGAEVAADLETDWQATALYPLRLEATLAEADDGAFTLRPLLLRQGDTRLRLAGSWHPETEEFNVLLDGQAVRWPLQGDAEYRLPALELKLAGRLQAYRLDLSAQVEGAALPPMAIKSTGQGSTERLALDSLRLDTLEGVVEGTGQLDWTPQLAWDFQLAARDINPGGHWAAWPGKLNTRLRTQGKQDAQGLTLSAVIEELAGVLRGYPVGGSGNVELNNDLLRINDIVLRSGQAELKASGTLADSWDLRWQLQAPELAELLPDLAGQVNAKGELTGTKAQPRLRAEAQVANLQAADLRLTRLDLSADLGLDPEAPLTVQMQGAGLRAGGRTFDQVAIDLKGLVKRHELSLQAGGSGHALNVAAAGGWDGKIWQGRVERGDWQLPEVGAWALTAPVKLRLSATEGNSDEFCWRQDSARLCSRIGYDKNGRTVNARLSDLPLSARLLPYLPPGAELQDSQLSAELIAEQKPSGATTARMKLQVSSGTLAWGEETQRKTAALKGVDAELSLDAKGIASTTQMRLSGTDQITFAARLPGYQLGQPLDRQPVSGRLSGEVRDFALVEGMLDRVDELSGVLLLDAGLSGTVAAPQFQGELRLNEGRAFVGVTGIQLEELQLALKATPGVAGLQLEGSARSGPGRLQLDGQLSNVGTDELQGALHLTGDAFEAINLPEARVLLTPDIKLALQPRAIAITGTLTIPEATLTPRDMAGVQTASRDVVLVQEELAPAPKWAVDSRVKVILGDKVQFDGFGLVGRFQGAIDVVDEPKRVSRARGELRIVDGLYTAYGQELTIETGRLLYRGGPIDNPGLDVRAVRKTGDILAGVKVYGYLQEPEMELYSQPSMAQADQLSYLLLGRPVQSASGSEGQMLYKAASSLGLKGGNLLAQTIGSSFGLDEVSVGGGDDLESAALVIGKYLSPRLYINYSVGLLDAANRLQIRYQLSRRFTVQTETGTATGADIIYSLER